VKKFGVDTLNITGGGAYRYAEEIQQKVNVPRLSLLLVLLPIELYTLNVDIYIILDRCK